MTDSASGLPSSARAVVIGAGIVGNSLVYPLARLGWRDLVLLDKGPLPNPGGSTGHASNFIFPVDHSKEMTQLTLESMRQYRETGTLHECGGVEGARVLANTEVEAIDVEEGRVRRVRTTRGEFDADIVAIACGVWSPLVARM